MAHRAGAGAVAALAAIAAWGAAGNGAHAAATAPRHITISTVGSATFKHNRFFTETVRYSRRSYTIASGGTITFEKGRHDHTIDPHTLTVVHRRQLPLTAVQIEECIADLPGTGCHIGDAARTPIVEPGAPGLHRPGDTYTLFPSRRGRFAPLRIRVSAPRGSTLYFMCAVHPWMQAVLHVR